MLELKNLSLPDLVDLLSDETAYYMKLHQEGAEDNLMYKSREIMKQLQTEIEQRKILESSNTGNISPVSFSRGIKE
jgi:hypothetical protein